jgi:hypothetical protein
MTHTPEAPLGACLGHEAGDSKGQQRCPADSCALALTSSEGSEQRRSPGHTVYGMQGVNASLAYTHSALKKNLTRIREAVKELSHSLR